MQDRNKSLLDESKKQLLAPSLLIDYFNWIKKIERSSHRIQNQIITLINELEIKKVPILLQLYSTIDKNEFIFLNKKLIEITQLNSLNETLLHQIKQISKEIHLPHSHVLLNMIKLITDELSIQHQQIIIIFYFCEIIILRKEKKFNLALDKIEKLIQTIKIYQKMRNSSYHSELSKNFLVNALCHKAKIHRTLAGTHFTTLDIHQLQLSRTSYELALIERTDYQIFICLGFLLNDLSEMLPVSEQENILKQALNYHQKAKAIDPLNPHANHGIGWDLYKLLRLEQQEKKPFDFKKMHMAQSAFLITECYNPNARLFHDSGLLNLINGNEEKALNEFSKGLQLDQYHILLLYERGNLYFQLGQFSQALEDFNLGSMLSAASEIFNKKFSCAIDAIKIKMNNEIKLLKQNVYQPQDKKLDIIKIAINAEYKMALRQLSTYAKLKNPIKVFISYAWGISQHEDLVKEIVNDLILAGFHLLYDRKEDRKGKHLWEFIDKMITEANFIIVIGTHHYLMKYQYRSKVNEQEHVLAAEGALISYMVGFNRIQSEKIIPLLLEGPAEKAFPPALLPKLAVDFWKRDRYLEMFSLISSMYNIAYDDKIFLNIIDVFKNSRATINKMKLEDIAQKYPIPLRQAINNTLFGNLPLNMTHSIEPVSKLVARL